MKRLFLASALSAIMATAAMVPAQAMPVPERASAQTDIQQVKVIIRYGHWRGHRGYRYHRPGYRRHVDGFWYPATVFSLGVVIGAQPMHRSHVRWCRDRYRSYRVSDDTFQPNDGPRRRCISP